MKTPLLISVVAFAAVLPLAAQERGPGKPMRDAATHEQIVQTLRRAQQADPMNRMEASEGEDPSVVNRPKDILSESDIISFNGIATLVPKRAIIQIPETYRPRLGFVAGSRLVGWPEFYALNRGWITTVEVSRAQAQGNVPLAEEVEEHLSKSRNLVVATFHGGPISKHPLKTPPEETVAVDLQTNTQR